MNQGEEHELELEDSVHSIPKASSVCSMSNSNSTVDVNLSCEDITQERREPDLMVSITDASDLPQKTKMNEDTRYLSSSS